MVRKYEVDSSNHNYISVDNVLLTKDMSNIIMYPASNSRSTYTIPNGVTSIGSYAFARSNNLIQITMPNTVTEIGQHSLESCSNLETISFSNNLVSIGDNALSGCKKLTSITIPSSVNEIGRYAFNSTGLTSATFENTNGWTGKDGSRNATFTSTSLAKPATAASYLRKSYFQFTWTRSD